MALALSRQFLWRPHIRVDSRPTYTSALGLYNYGARFYSTTLGRFVSADPAGICDSDSQRRNAYTYVRSSPLSRVDDSGMKDAEPRSDGLGHVPSSGVNRRHHPRSESRGLHGDGKVFDRLLLFISWEGDGWGRLRRDEAQGVVREIAPADQPLVVLFGEHGADEPHDGGAVREDADDVGAPADLEVEAFLRVVRAGLLLQQQRALPAAVRVLGG